MRNFEELKKVETREGGLYMERLMHIENKFEKRLKDIGRAGKINGIMPVLDDSHFGDIILNEMSSSFL